MLNHGNWIEKKHSKFTNSACGHNILTSLVLSSAAAYYRSWKRCTMPRTDRKLSHNINKTKKKTAQNIWKAYSAFFSFRENYSAKRKHQRPCTSIKKITKEWNHARNGQKWQTITQYNNHIGINKIDLNSTSKQYQFTKQTVSIMILRYKKFQSSVLIISYLN